MEDIDFDDFDFEEDIPESIDFLLVNNHSYIYLGVLVKTKMSDRPRILLHIHGDFALSVIQYNDGVFDELFLQNNLRDNSKIGRAHV